jgi:hypothetical protein
MVPPAILHPPKPVHLREYLILIRIRNIFARIRMRFRSIFARIRLRVLVLFA